jgi:RNA polymerase sigma factor (sigma-70 family)
MPRRQLNAVVDFIRRFAIDGPSDRELLEQFTRRRDEDAFACLIRRHGPLVLGLCRRLLRREQDAEDVFQATFLVLARKAASIRKREALASWLHGVAVRLAMRARAVRRRWQERPVMDVPVHDPLPEFIWRDLRRVLDEEIHCLPHKYREPFVLCHLQGKTNPEAAQELGCPLGTILSRLARARELLRKRLVRRGVSLCTGLLLSALAENATSAAVPSAYFEKTMKAAMVFAAAKRAVGGVVSVQAAALAEGVLGTMFITHARIVAGVLLLAGVIATSVYSYQAAPEKSRARSVGQAKDGPARSRDREDREESFQDPDKESLRLANKLLQEDIEDAKARLEALQKKLERLKKSDIKVTKEDDPQLAELKRENRRLHRELKRMQDDVQLAEEEVQPYVQSLHKAAGRETSKDKGDWSPARYPRPGDEKKKQAP